MLILYDFEKKIGIILFLLISFTITAGNINDMFTQRTAAGESVFFIRPQKLPTVKGEKCAGGKIEYDYTYVQRTDSVALIMSAKLDEVATDIVCDLRANGSDVRQKAEVIYVKPKGKLLEYRLRVYLSFEEFEKIYLSKEPFVLCLELESRGEQKNYYWGLKQSDWKKNRENMLGIIDLIKLNTGKRV